MDKGRNLAELKEELDNLGFNTKEFIDDVRKSVYEGTLHKQLAYQEGQVRLNLNFGQDDFSRFNFFDYNVHYRGTKQQENFQAFEAEVPLPEAIQLLESRTQSQLYNIPDAQTPLFLDDVRLEQRALDQNKLNSPGVFGGIDTVELEKRMLAVDWHRHPGHWANSTDDPQDSNLMEIKSIERELDTLESLWGNREALNISEKLMLRYFTGTPVEKIIKEDIPYLKASFEVYKKQQNQEQIKIESMNKQNLSYLEKQLLNLGFGEKLNEELGKKIVGKVPEFTLDTAHEFNQKKVDYTLYFKAGNEQDMYFLNKYDTRIGEGEKRIDQTFYINKGHGVTAKEAFNLMEGRAVYKHLYNQQDEKYNAWIKLDEGNRTEGGNLKFKQYNDKYGFEPEKILAAKGIKEMDGGQKQEDLLRSLRKGNAQQITVTKEDGEQKYFIAANPQYKTVDLFDGQMKKIKREEVLGTGNSKKEENKQDHKQKEGLDQKKPAKSRKNSVGS